MKIERKKRKEGEKRPFSKVYCSLYFLLLIHPFPLLFFAIIQKTPSNVGLGDTTTTTTNTTKEIFLFFPPPLSYGGTFSKWSRICGGGRGGG